VSIWIRKIYSKNAKSLNFHPVDSKKSILDRTKNTQVKVRLAPCIIAHALVGLDHILSEHAHKDLFLNDHMSICPIQ